MAGLVARLVLPSLISDGMVLQRGAGSPIWGWASPGGPVQVDIAGQSHLTVADVDGKWMVELDSIEEPGSHGLSIDGGDHTQVRDVLVGEVFLCSGQSNMEWPLSETDDAAAEIAAADSREIRLFTVPKEIGHVPQALCGGKWEECSRGTVASFSAVAYHFGRRLHEELGVPIGLIHTSWGGTPSEAWTSLPALKADPEFEPLFERWAEQIRTYPEDLADYETKLLPAYEKAVREAGRRGDPPPSPLWPPQGPDSQHRPANLYNAMIAPLVPYGIRGAIWYQGESNADRAVQYRKLFPTLIRDWRRAWGQGDFDFLFVQLANFMEPKKEPGDSAWAELREAQAMALALPNTGMAVTIDVGEADDIHPRNKRDVGHRLAQWALAMTYGRDIVPSGPLFREMAIEGDEARLSFDHVDCGLVAKGRSLRGFALAGGDRRFRWATAEIDGDQVVLGADGVVKPVAARYAWADNPDGNLYNRSGLPASPFRTDDWPALTEGKH